MLISARVCTSGLLMLFAVSFKGSESEFNWNTFLWRHVSQRIFTFAPGVYEDLLSIAGGECRASGLQSTVKPAYKNLQFCKSA